MLWTLLVIVWVMIWALVLVDVVRRHDLSRGAKAAWAILALVVPVIGVLIYLIIRPPEAKQPRFADAPDMHAPGTEAYDGVRDRHPT
jgi:Phospholipase_D-nuclease N-terminal